MGIADRALVKRASEGDQRAFRMLVERYQRKVYSVALGMLKNREDANDVAQDAFAKVYQYLPRFSGNASFYTWLYRITVNICIDVLRRRSHHAGPSAEDFDEAMRSEVVEASAMTSPADPQSELLRHELSEHLREAISELPDAHRAILLLREIEGLSYEELATTLEIPKGTVMSRLYHARVKLQKRLTGYAEREPSTKPSDNENL